jgi:hypothetical protein
MSTSAEIRINGNGNAHHEHLLRPRAIKPGNLNVLRTMSEEGLLSGKENAQNGTASGQTRYAPPPSSRTQLIGTVAAQLQSQQMLPLRSSRSLQRENSSELSNGGGCSRQLNMPRESRTSIPTAIIEISKVSTYCSG